MAAIVPALEATADRGPAPYDVGERSATDAAGTQCKVALLGVRTGWCGEGEEAASSRTRLRTIGAMGDISSTVVFRWLAAGDAGELEAFDVLLHPDAVIHAPAGLSTTSADEEKAVWRDALSAMPDLRHDVQEVVVGGDVEMARVVVTGTLTTSFGGVEGTGGSFRIDQAVITHLRDGKVVEAWEIADIAALRTQVANR